MGLILIIIGLPMGVAGEEQSEIDPELTEIIGTIKWEKTFLGAQFYVDDELYSLRSIEHNGYPQLRSMYEGDEELLANLLKAEDLSKLLTFYTMVGYSFIGADLFVFSAGGPVTWTLGFLGVMMQIGYHYFFPVNHFHIIEKTVNTYNQRIIDEAKAAQNSNSDTD